LRVRSNSGRSLLGIVKSISIVDGFRLSRVIAVPPAATRVIFLVRSSFMTSRNSSRAFFHMALYSLIFCRMLSLSAGASFMFRVSRTSIVLLISRFGLTV
jgi:hypothetical protein